MEEFVCNAKLNLIRLVSDRLQKKYSVTITLGDLILEDDSGEQWIQVTDGSAEQRRAVKHYLITLCNSEDACIFTYDEKYECSIQAHQDELERNSGACLVLSQPGVVNIYGSEFSVTMAQTALEDMKEKFGDIDDEDEGLTEAQLNEKLKVKCAEHDIMFEDYVHASLPVKRTLYRWLSHDMDHSSSLVEEEPDAPCDNDLEMDCPVIDLDKTLSGIDVQDSRVKIILKRGYALQEYNDVIREIGDQSGIPAILTKLLDNRRKKGLTPPLSIPRTSDVGSTDNDTATSNATSSGISSATSTGIGVGTDVADVVLGNTEAAKNDDVIDLTSESAVDLSLYFEEYFEEGPNLTREEYIERNLKRQQLLLAEAQKLKKQKAENASQALINALTKVPDEATEQVKKKKNKKKRQKKKAKGSTPKKSDSSSSDEVEIMITEETSPVNTPTKNYSKTPARNVDTIGNKARVNLALQHSPMAENTTVKKKQKTSEILSDVIVGPSEGPLQSTPLLNPPTQEEWQIAGARALRGRPDSVERTLVPTESRVPLPMSDYVAKGASNLRPIVIDGSNVACAHGRQQVFSSRGIQIAVDFFKNRGHQDVTVFVPNWRKGGLNAAMPTKDSDILLQLEKDGILSFTPSRYLNGKKLVCYDDRFIVELAADNDGVVVSNDNFRDLINESPKWKRVIESRLLMYTFAGNKFMVPDDPLGPQGPRLEQMLTKAPTKRQPQSSLAGAPLLPGIVRPLVQAPGAPGPVYAPAPFASLPGLAPSPVLARGGALGSMPSSSLASSWGAIGAPGGPSRDFSGRPTWNTLKPPPCRPIAQTEALYKQLLELFPNIPSVIQRILDNHMNETDVNKLTIHILDVIK